MKGTSSDGRRKKEAKQQKQKECKLFCHNKEKGTFCNRTPHQWLLIASYYIIFLSGICIIFLLILSSIKRSFTQGGATPPIKKEYLEDNSAPGITILPNRVDNHKPSIIWYTNSGKDNTNNRQYKNYVNEISKLLTEQSKLCNDNAICRLYCHFNESDFGPCSPPHFGYNEDKPCLFIKLNRFPTWRPGTYEHKSEIQKHVPDRIKKKIKLSEETVWIDCVGNKPYDEEKIGKISYYPDSIFNDKYFPYPEIKCAIPVLAIQLPEIQKGAIVQLDCSAYAKNMANQNQDDTFIYIHHK